MTYRASLPGNATVYVTTTAEGNFADSDMAASCSMLHQIHGNSVRRVESGQIGELGDGDALISTSSDVALAVRGADCPLIGLSCEEGVIAAVHAGWKGLYAGVIEQAVAAMRIFGATDIYAIVGPFIGTECYEFGDPDLALMVDSFGDRVRGVTKQGTAALNLDACISSSFHALGVLRQRSLGTCTSCSTEFNSWRKRKDTERHALVISRSDEFAQRFDPLTLQ